jgi:hypothetical protein
MGLAGGAVVAAVVIGLGAAPSARADDTGPAEALTGLTPAELLADAQTELTEANNVLSQVPSNDIPNDFVASLLADQVQEQNTALASLSGLESAEDSILSYDNGALSDLLTPVFTDLDQNWLDASQAKYAGDYNFDLALVNGIELATVEIGTAIPDFEVFGDVFSSDAIEQAASLLSSF